MLPSILEMKKNETDVYVLYLKNHIYSNYNSKQIKANIKCFVLVLCVIKIS